MQSAWKNQNYCDLISNFENQEQTRREDKKGKGLNVELEGKY